MNSKEKTALAALKRRGYSFGWSTPEDSDLVTEHFGECQLFDEDGRAVSYWAGEVTSKEEMEGILALEHLQETQEVRS